MKKNLCSKFLTPFLLIATLTFSFFSFASPGFAGGEDERPAHCYKELSSTRWIAWLQRKFLKKCSVELGCDQRGPEQMLSCLQNQASVDFQLQQDPHLQKMFDQDQDLRTLFISDPTYRTFLRDIELKKLFEGPSGVREGYLVGEHTTMALIVFASQQKFFGLETLERPTLIKDKLKFMKYLVAYHDVGKSISAHIFNDNRKEIAFSYPIAWRLMNVGGFTEAESKLAISLIHLHKHIGGYLQSKMNLVEITSELKSFADFNSITTQEFYHLLEILYVADAGSYPYLKTTVFKTDPDGRMSIKDPKIDLLRASL